MIWLFGHPKDGRDGGDDGKHRGADLPAAVFVVLLAVFGFHVDDVVLLQVEARRLEEVLAAQVVHEHLALAVDFADHGHAVYLGLGREVAGIGDGLEQGDAVAVDREGAAPRRPARCI